MNESPFIRCKFIKEIIDDRIERYCKGKCIKSVGAYSLFLVVCFCMVVHYVFLILYAGLMEVSQLPQLPKEVRLLREADPAFVQAESQR